MHTIEVEPEHKKWLSGSLVALVMVLVLFVAVKFFAEARDLVRGGSGDANTITLSGYGEVTAAPDIANVYFTIEKEAKTVKAAQDAVASTEAKVLEYLRGEDVEDRDIQTSNASFYPKYETARGDRSILPCNEFYCPPVPDKTVIVGYVASESITLKVRDIDAVGDLMTGLGERGVSQLSGPNFSIDDEDMLKADARKKAIEDAREKAKALAKDLGVRLGRVVTFSESDYPVPFYSRGAALMAEDAAQKAPSAELPTGENIISSNVTLTYEIR
jgi:uncharacterized protein